MEHQSSTNLHTTTKPNIKSNISNKPQQSSGKRDYVASPITQKPQSTSLPHHTNAGKVQDLINFYDNKNNNNNGQNIPSYSSILRGNNNRGVTTVNLPSTKPPVSPSVQNNPTVSTPKPLSFSAVVAGPNKQPSPATIPTSKPSTKSPPNSQPQTTLPGFPVLPSSILNQNRKNNNNQNNANGPTDAELQTLSEELLRKDTNNAAKYLTINYQEKTTSQSKVDNAALP